MGTILIIVVLILLLGGGPATMAIIATAVRDWAGFWASS